MSETSSQPKARTTSITIGSQLDEFVESLIKSGRYGSASEVVRAALRLLERQENQALALKYVIEEGDQSGESGLTLHEAAAQVKMKHNV